MMRVGSTPIFRTSCISPLEAQSKPVPWALSTFRTTGSGLHLTAFMCYEGFGVSYRRMARLVGDKLQIVCVDE